jgi:hypothetical protein
MEKRKCPQTRTRAQRSSWPSSTSAHDGMLHAAEKVREAGYVAGTRTRRSPSTGWTRRWA